MDVHGPLYKLDIHDVDSRDSGDYAIVVKGHRSAARLNVEAKPEFTMQDKYMEPLVLRVGASAAIEVPFHGSPQPRAVWKKNNIMVIENRRLHVDTVYNLTALSINRASRDDAGSYSLTLENQFGGATLNIDVIVLGKYFVMICVFLSVMHNN
jgi:titin